MDSDNLDKLHQRLEEVRVLQKISYRKMADVIGYSDTGLRTALINRNLSLQNIQTIVGDFEMDEFFTDLLGASSPLLNKTDSNTIEDIVADKVVEKIKPYLQKIELIEAVLGKMLLERGDVKNSKKN